MRELQDSIHTQLTDAPLPDSVKSKADREDALRSAAKGGRVRALPPTPCPRSSPSLGEPLLRFSHGWGGTLPCRKCTPWRIPGCLSCGRPVGMDSVL